VALHLLSAARLAADLADDDVAVRDQAIYLAVSFALWLVPGYLHVYPVRAGSGATTFWLWQSEFVALFLVHFAGAFYCLRQCRVEPRRNFLVDFTCLSAPVTLFVLVATWLGFYVALGIVGKVWPNAWSLETFHAVHDALLSIVVVVEFSWMYRRVGKYMARAAEMRANAVEPPAAAAVTLG
jgi:hypothetical protein